MEKTCNDCQEPVGKWSPNYCNACFYRRRNARLNERNRLERLSNPKPKRIYLSGEHSLGYKGTKHITSTQFSKWRFNALDRKKEWSLTIKDIEALWVKQDGICGLTGRRLESTDNHPNRMSLDRIDSGKGYVKGNVQLTTWVANQAKYTLTVKEFVAMAKDVVAYNENKPQNTRKVLWSLLPNYRQSDRQKVI